MSKYAVKIESKEVRYVNNEIATNNGDQFWLCSDDGYWTGSNVDREYKKLPSNLITFNTIEKATRAAKIFKGHPWWVDPKPGKFEIVEVAPKMVQDGWVVK